ncbi:uncharacterized protein V1518DRAFT_416150 [Limtongia smithiae]|uniref:uncharacterized protein n=1 Tax=Limtongia smithiae TaxID=1125753 RepID=UPI0034CD9F08
MRLYSRLMSLTILQSLCYLPANSSCCAPLSTVMPLVVSRLQQTWMIVHVNSISCVIIATSCSVVTIARCPRSLRSSLHSSQNRRCYSARFTAI